MLKRSKEKLWIGAHVSAQGGPYRALLEGKSIGATTIQFFTANQRRWKGTTISQKQVELWEETLKETGMEKIMSHDSYLINLGSPDQEGLLKSRKAFQEEIQRCHQLNLSFLNFHPGAALTDSKESCLKNIVKSLLSLASLINQGKTRLLIETTAGQGSAVGHRFEDLHYLIEHLHKEIPVGICIDTCHIFAAGYDISSSSGWNTVLKEFDHVIGLKHLYALHLNDSLKPCGSRVDRHLPLGKGHIGMDAFKKTMTHPSLKKLPKYLETPGGPSLWRKEIQQLMKF